jgi:hypothetical protein
MARFLPWVFAGLSLLVANTAMAGCDPKCATGSTCRYEAAGGKYYCAPNKTGIILKGGTQEITEPTRPGTNIMDTLIKK